MIVTTKPEYKRLPLDSNKRHWVFGDIHGRFDTVMQLLDEINYDVTTDVLYTVGDMIDRGYRNMDTLRFFTEHPNHHTVMGNHEWMVMEPTYRDVWLDNGGMNTLIEVQADGYDEQWLIDKINTLPHIIDVGEDEDPHAFRILHAELPPNLTDEMISAAMGTEYLVGWVLWSRSNLSVFNRESEFGTVDPKFVQQLVESINKNHPRKTFVGHSWVEQPLQVGTYTYLDTGPGNLTIYNAITGENYGSRKSKQ